MGKQLLQWHPAFQAACRVELLEDKEFLRFEEEYNLSKSPLRMDTLIIKLEPGHVVKKSMGRIFKRHNIIEYKSPDDYLSINDFYKVMGYACVYQSDTKEVLEILPEEVTVTLMCSHKPKKLIRHLQKIQGAEVREAYKGIYYVEGLLFSLQIVETCRLPKDEYVWLSRLRRGLDIKEDIEPLARMYKRNAQDPLYQAVMELIVRANEKQYKEGRKMCEALRELFAEELLEKEAAGREQGVLLKLVSQVRRKIQKNMSALEIADQLEDKPELIEHICKAIKENPKNTDETIVNLLQEERTL